MEAEAEVAPQTVEKVERIEKTYETVNIFRTMDLQQNQIITERDDGP